jgi:GNAT superfamily N-acetyltransferase
MVQITISDDKTRLDVNIIHKFLTKSYWAKGRTLEEVRSSIEHSDCYGVYSGEKQIGFARIISDYIIFAYLMDVFILEEYRGNGYSKLLLKKIFEDEKFRNVKKWMLATKDAHPLYEKFGFKKTDTPERLMVMVPAEKHLT